ncbi:hypothetical protein, partial [Proteus mirabilis]
MGRDALTRGKRDIALALVRQAKRRAARKGLPFDLTSDDIVVPDFCPALGIPLYRAVGRKAQGPNSPTLDRIEPDLGYVRGNVRVISARANQIKSDATPSELLRVAC